MPKSNDKVAFFICGSVAAFKACSVVSQLVRAGAEVQCVMTAAAKRFVGEATLEGLTGRPVLSDLWERGRAMDHIHLSRWADFGVVCPASANSLAQMSLGLANDAVSSTLLAWPDAKPLFVFPAMNGQMLRAAPTQNHIESLRSRGIYVADCSSGSLACGEIGEGRLPEPEEILRVLFSQTSTAPTSSPRDLTAPSLLITSGATRESIDGIRFITNHSTGRTGAELAEFFARQGFTVTLLHGAGAMTSSAAARCTPFADHTDLEKKLRAELGLYNYQAVIHSAAVSDYAVQSIEVRDGQSRLDRSLSEEKLPSNQDLTLRLTPTRKILPALKRFSRNPNIRVIGFKLTLNATQGDLLAAADQILTQDVDAIVANDWAQVSTDRSRHPGILCLQKSNSRIPFSSVTELGEALIEELNFASPPQEIHV